MKRSKKLKFAATGALALAASRPATVLACAACYGQSDSAMAKGMNWGIFSMLAVIACVLGTVTVFFVHIGRRSAALRELEDSIGELPAKQD